MKGLVLDASAVIALLRDEPGADSIRELLDELGTPPASSALLSTVNLTEVHQLLGPELPEIIDGPDDVITTAVYDQRHAREAAALLPATRAAGLGLGDRACLALAKVSGLPALTADRAWSAVDVGVDVIQAR